MTDQPLFTLDAEAHWRLAYDDYQWVIQRRRPNGRFRAEYVGLRIRADLFRCLRLKEILITQEALRRIDTELMSRFADWKAACRGDRPLDPVYIDSKGRRFYMHGETDPVWRSASRTRVSSPSDDLPNGNDLSCTDGDLTDSDNRPGSTAMAHRAEPKGSARGK